MEDSTPLSASVMMGDSVKDLGAPLLPSTGRASFKPSVKRRRLVFDMLFGVLFGIFAIVMVVLAFTMGLQAVSNRKTPAVVTVDDKEEPTSRMVTSLEGLKALIGVVIVSAVGIFMSTAWIQVMIWCAPALIGYTLLSIALLGVGSAITFFATGNITGGVVTTVVTLVGLSYFHILKRRVHFASANIKVACQAIRDNPPVLALGFLLLLLQVAWSLIWTLAVLGAATNAKATTITAGGHTYSMSQCTTYKVAAPNMDFSPSCAATTGGWCTKCMCAGSLVYDGRGCFSYRLYGGWLAVLLLGFVWGCTVLRNIGHCAISGTVGMWWISGSNRSSMAVWSNLRRALTSSFGSICLGSLLVAIVKTLRQILLAMHKSNRSTTRMNTLSAVLDCMLAVVDRALSLFNKYALVYVALYGLDFMSAGAATTELFKARGITAIVNDTLIDTVLGLGSMIVGLVCAVVSYLYGVDAGLSHPNVVVLTVAGAFIGAALGFVVATIMESAVSTVFVCFAEDPKALEISHPDLSDRLVEAWETMLQGPISELGASGLGKEGLGGSWQGAPAPAASEIETTMTSSGVAGAPAMPEGDVEEKKCMDV